MDATPSLKMLRSTQRSYPQRVCNFHMWLLIGRIIFLTQLLSPMVKKSKQAIYKARQHEIQTTVSEERWQGKLIKSRWDDEKVKVLCVAFFMEECPSAYHRWSTKTLPTTVTYQGLLQQKNKITSN